jgi:hypothetical protein
MKIMTLVLLGLTVTTLPAAVVGQESVEADKCAASTADPNVASEFLNADGYPRQMAITQDVLVVSTTPPCIDGYTFTMRNGDVVFAKDAAITYSGQWKKIAFRRVAKNGSEEELSYSNAKEVSEEIAHEASVGLAASITAGVKPFGVGAEATVEASLGYALSIANGTSEGTEWGHTLNVGPGEEVVVWTRQVEVKVAWEPSAYDIGKFGQEGGPETGDIFQLGQNWVEDVYIPSQKRMFQTAQSLTDDEATALANATAVHMKPANWPAKDAVDVVFANQAVSQMSEFMQTHDEPLTDEYTLPFRETYTVRYKY